MDIFRILAFCLCALVLVSVLRQYHPSFGIAAALAACLVLLMMTVRALEPLLAFLRTLTQFSGYEYLNSVLRAVVIALLCQGVQDLCTEAGQTALAGRVELAGKVAVLLAALPLFAALTDILLSVL